MRVRRRGERPCASLRSRRSALVQGGAASEALAIAPPSCRTGDRLPTRHTAARHGRSSLTSTDTRSAEEVAVADAARPDTNRRGLLVAVVVLGIAALLTLGILLGTRLAAPSTPAESRPTAAAASESPPPTVADIYNRVVVSMVVITTDQDRLGSGVVANRDGEILTAAHVVTGADTIHVAFADGTETTATVASSDEASDIATLIPADLPETLVPATLGGSRRGRGPGRRHRQPARTRRKRLRGRGVRTRPPGRHGRRHVRGAHPVRCRRQPRQLGGSAPGRGWTASSGSSSRSPTRARTGPSPASASRSRSARPSAETGRAHRSDLTTPPLKEST